MPGGELDMIANPRPRSAAWILPVWLGLHGLLIGACGSSYPITGKADCSSGKCKPVVVPADGGMAGSSGSADGGSAGASGSSSATISIGKNGSAGSGGAGGADGGAGTSGASPTCSPGANCSETWQCTPWQTAKATPAGATLPSGDNAGTRTCTDLCKCGTTTSKPVEAATLPKLDFAFYQCEIEPVFNGLCAQLACHGSEKNHPLRVYARSKLRITGEMWTSNVCGDTNKMVKSESCIGSNECECWQLPHSPTEWQRNYDAARGFALDAKGKALANMTTSPLVQQGLSLAQGGLPHAGVQLTDTSAVAYKQMVTWLTGTGKGCATAALQSN
jgi:hypothetical protein